MISGTIRGLEAAASFAGREVELVNVATEERQRVVTNSAGGFTFNVRPGQYRVEVVLAAGESIVNQPGVVQVRRRADGAHADFVIGTTRTSKRRPPVTVDPSLGPPIA